MNTISIKTLGDTSVETIHRTFLQAFSDYVEPCQLSYQQLKYMIERRGCDLNLSFGAFANDKLVSFLLNGIGIWNGKRTAYDTGTGTIKAFRKQGIATKILNESLSVLPENGVSQYLLEVIRTNTSAIELYRKTGFEVTREFDYYVSPKTNIQIREEALNFDLTVKKIESPDWDKFKTFWDFHPSWQNSIDSITHKIHHFTILGMYDKDDLLGYGIIENHTGDIPQIAVGKPYRRIGLATMLLKNLLKNNETDDIRIINTVADYEPFREFARSVNLHPGHGQFEMLLKL